MADHAHTHEGFDVEVERHDDGTAKVSFTVSAAEFDKAVALGLQNIGRRTRMKGFRQGKVPARMLEKQFGEEVRKEALQHFLNHAYDEAVKKHELRPAAHPRVDLDQLSVERGQPFSYDFRVFLRPEIKLGEYKGLEVEKRAIAVTDEEVEAALADLRRQRSRAEAAGPEGLAADGMAICRLAFFLKGSDAVILERENIRLSPKSAPAGIDPAAFEQGLTGAKEGAVVDIPLVFPEEFPEPEVHGKEGICRVTVGQIFSNVPPTAQELYELLEVEDEASMKVLARQRIAEAKESEEQARIEIALLDQVIEQHDLKIPGEYLEEQVQAKVEETRRNLMSQGLAREAADAQVEEQLEGFRASTEKGLRAVYLLEEIARVEELKVTQEEMLNELKIIATRNSVTLDEVRKYYQENRMLPQLALELLERKVRRFLRESADIREASA
jgi:trigger factor